jgi:hypothetical protein
MIIKNNFKKNIYELFLGYIWPPAKTDLNIPKKTLGTKRA